MKKEALVAAKAAYEIEYEIKFDEKFIENPNYLNNIVNVKDYYDEIGQKYTMRSKKLVNRVAKDYYEEMLKYLGKTFLMHQQMQHLHSVQMHRRSDTL